MRIKLILTSLALAALITGAGYVISGTSAAAAPSTIVNPHYKGASAFNLAGVAPNVARCGAFPENIELSFTGQGKVETALACRAGVPSRSTGHAEGNCVLVRSRASGRIDYLHEGICFDEDLIATPDVSVSRLQIKDFIGCGFGTSGKDRGVQAALRIDALSGESQLDVLRKSSATSHVWCYSCQIEG